jgi:hypothetical protein
VTIRPEAGGSASYAFAAVADEERAWVDVTGFAARLLRPIRSRGAIVDLISGNDSYDVYELQAERGHAIAWVVDEQRGSAARGARKGFLAPTASDLLIVCFELPPRVSVGSVDVAPSGGRAPRETAPSVAGARRPRPRRTLNWVARAHDEDTSWSEQDGGGLRLVAHQRHFHVALGRGPADARRSQEHVAWGRHILHRSAPVALLGAME